ncbi:hypothetical protein [Jeotgalibacillus salarius]|uniref:Uncharacterized protein n=1 Tax=Jeotgalibacillus salarius TaxID=546023 RepID=A0A4Y8LKR4_9BACL|nr:hypothetical protein [Jeotgalibacillus salarius]TFE02359.1 hypothetical protein E2626_07205 [Jeotgalibacillus salarius]
MIPINEQASPLIIIGANIAAAIVFISLILRSQDGYGLADFALMLLMLFVILYIKKLEQDTLSKKMKLYANAGYYVTALVAVIVFYW